MKIRIGDYDTIWAKMVRTRDGRCVNCGKMPPYQLQAHHIRPRGRKSTRFLLENGMTLCAHCHTLGPHAVHRIGDRPFMEPLIGKREFNRLDKLSGKYKSESKAIQEFKEKYGV